MRLKHAETILLNRFLQEGIEVHLEQAFDRQTSGLLLFAFLRPSSSRGLLLGLAGEKEVEDVTSIGNFQKPQ